MASLLRSHALFLICLFQAGGGSCYPLFHGAAEPTAPMSCIDGLPATQTTIPCRTEVSNNVIYQIPDGQIQAPVPYELSGQPSSSETLSSTNSELSARPFSTATSIFGITISSSIILTETAFLAANSTAQFSTHVPASLLTSLTPSAVQTTTASGTSHGGGTIVSSLEQTISSLPFLTRTSYTTHSLSLVDTSVVSEIQPTATSIISTLSVPDIFQPIANDSLPAQVSQRADHPVARLNINPQERKLQTNKFYSNLYLGDQSNAIFTFPYSINWVRGGLLDIRNESSQSWGMAISHIDRTQFVHADRKFDQSTGLRVDAGNWSFYSNPLGTNAIVLSANELIETQDGYPGLATNALEWGSVTADLYAHGWLTPTVRFPLVQGTSFITADYSWASPLIQSGYGFNNLTYNGAVPSAGNNATFKYTARLSGETPTTWLIYITPDQVLSPHYSVDRFTYDGVASIQGASGFCGLIQVAKVPVDTLSDDEIHSLYDHAAGAYAAKVHISGSTQGDVGTYTLSWEKRGNPDQSLLMFALPHHLSSFNADTADGVKNDLALMTPTKGISKAVQGESWTLVESHMPVSMNFFPYSPSRGPLTALSDEAFNTIRTVGAAEVAQDIVAQTNTNTTYYDGKALAKFAGVIFVLHQMVAEERLAASGLLALQAQFDEHVQGRQTYPLIYESAWGGTVSSATYIMADVEGASGYDFGNTYYNDHHFHYGYFVYAAAVIAYLDPDWLRRGTNKAWVNMLVRDYANSVEDDSYFPFSRSFDWYHGHSWAAGLFASADGKNQESSSEDTMASYAIKMWGQVIGDSTMMARGNLMLAIQARSFSDYYLYDSQNAVQPAEVIGNKAAGILFENKIDHATYFGALPEYTQGIHMIPILPYSTYIRTPTFVRQEWDTYFANYSDGTQPYVNQVQGGWRGILMANHAIVDANTSYEFFDNDKFDQIYLDGGASQTWYLAWAATLKEAGSY